MRKYEEMYKEMKSMEEERIRGGEERQRREVLRKEKESKSLIGYMREAANKEG